MGSTRSGRTARPRRHGRARQCGRPSGPVTLLCRPKARPLILLDWDDTLLPTTFLQSNDVLGTPIPDPCTLERIEPGLDAYAAVACGTLAQLKALGDVVIVTNASDGWVEQTGELFTPDLLELLQGCKIVSARSAFEPQGYGAHEWKQRCFSEQIETHLAQGGLRTVLSIGDAAYERDAVQRVAPALGCCAQSVKLMRTPTLAELQAEHELLQPLLEGWVAAGPARAALDLCLCGGEAKGFGPEEAQVAKDLRGWTPSWSEVR